MFDFSGAGAFATECRDSRLLVAWYSQAYGRRRACQWELTAAYLAGEAEGNPAGRILVVNPLTGLGHIQPQTLRDAPVLSADDLDDTVRRIRAHLATLTTPLGQVARIDGGPWHGSRRASSPRFVGRMAEMWAVHSVLSAPANQAALLGMQHSDTGLVHGLGGIGKSLLAEEYAARYRAAYPGGTVWLSATAGDAERGTQLFTLAVRWGLPVEGEKPERVEALLQEHLAKLGPYLWIVDDLPSDADPAMLDRWRAPSGNGRTLITTRGTGLADCTTPVPLGVLGEEDAYELLTSRRPPRDPAEETAAWTIVAELGHHPLALDVAGAAVQRMGYAALLEDLADRSREVLGLAADLTGHLPGGHEPSIAATLLHSIRRLDANGLRLLQLAALLAVAPIPLELVTNVWAAGDTQAGRNNALRAITNAERESLIEHDGGLFVHALVSRVTHRHAPPAETLRAAAVAVLNTVMATAATVDIREHARVTEWVPHAQALTQTAEDAGTLRLLGLLCRHAHVRGEYAAGATLGRRLWQTSRRVLGDEHPDTLTAMNNLASSLRALGDFVGARALHELALEVRRRVLGEEHPATLRSMSNLAGTLKAQGNLSAARVLHERVVIISRQILGEEAPDTLVSMHNLADTLYAQGDLSAARVLHEKVVIVRRQILGDEHPDTLTSVNALASTLYAQGDLNAARALQEQELTVCRRVLGEEHPETLTSMNDLAATLWAQGDLAAARALQEQVLVVRRRVLGEEHPDTLTSMNNLANILCVQGDPAAARMLQEEALAVLRRVLGEGHPHTLISMHNLAGTLYTQGDLTAARALVNGALPVCRAKLGPAHELTQSLLALDRRLPAGETV